MSSPDDYLPWTDEEIAILREAYARGGRSAACEALPHRSESSVMHKGARAGVYRRRRWTAEDDRRLRVLWSGEWTLRSIATQLNRSEITTYWRAQRLGLRLGCPPGWERISHAAARAGYDTGQLRAILRWADVDIHRAITRPTRRRGKRTSGGLSRIVWPADVDLAVARWLEAEPLESAARRVGMCAETLSRRLRLVGVEKSGARKTRWRVTPEQVDAAMLVQVPRPGTYARTARRGEG